MTKEVVYTQLPNIIGQQLFALFHNTYGILYLKYLNEYNLFSANVKAFYKRVTIAV